MVIFFGEMFFSAFYYNDKRLKKFTHKMNNIFIKNVYLEKKLVYYN